MDAFTATPLCPSPRELELDEIAFREDQLIVTARRTARAMTALDTIACALGGRAGARLAHALGLPIGASALVAHLRAPADSVARGSTAEAAVTTDVMPRVLGIDDWAWRRGERYG